MTNEQIVTDILVSNQILKPLGGFSETNHSANLGAYLSTVPVETEVEPLPKSVSKYTFIDLQKKWL